MQGSMEKCSPRRRTPRSSSSPTRYIHPAEPVYHVQPPRPAVSRSYVGGHHVRLDSVMLGVGRGSSVIHGVQHMEHLHRLVTVSQAGHGSDQPERRVGVPGPRSRGSPADIPGCSRDPYALSRRQA